MCIVIYFGYAPPLQKLALCMKPNPLECEEVNVSVTSSAPARLELPRSIRPPQVPAFPQEAVVWSPALPQLGGLMLELSLAARWPARGVFKWSSVVSQRLEADRAQNYTVKKES